ncbi:4-hydroxy-3-methylbut-2-enyl diphosphate reductase, chloroplastic [Capsicum chinense]|nr:4-hydroxy-3-methylbut-2-enyl diphosphate reductase, chloroplastic [Capsicum chinense]
MRKYLNDMFKLNVSYSTMKRVKRLLLGKLEGSYIDEFRKLEAYAQELRESNTGTDMIINMSKEALNQGKRRFLRIYVFIQALKNGWKAVKSNGDQGYEVVEDEDTHVVHLGRKKCTCRTLELIELQNMVGIPKVTRKREKTKSRKRKGVWSASRKEMKMVCGYCGATGHIQRKCPLNNNSTQHTFLSTGCSNPKTNDKKSVGASRSKNKSIGSELHIAPSIATVSDTEEDESEDDDQPTIKPKRIFEAKTRLEAQKSLEDKEVKNIPLEERKKNFDVVDKGDIVVLLAFVAVVDEILVLSDKKVTVLAHVSVLCFTSSATVFIFTDIPATYVYDYIFEGKLDGSSSTKDASMQKFIYAVFDGFDPDVDLVTVGIANQTTMLKGETEDIEKLVEKTMMQRFGVENINNHFVSFNTICDATQSVQGASTFAIDEGEASVIAPNIFLVNQPSLNEEDVGIGTDAESEEEDNNEPIPSDYDSEEFEFFRKEKHREVNDQLDMFLELEKDKKSQGFKINTLNKNHTCLSSFKNRRATQDALAHYFKKKIHNDPKYKVTDMRKHLNDMFKLNVSYSTMKRVKTLILEKLEDSYIDEFNKLEAYAQELGRAILVRM